MNRERTAAQMSVSEFSRWLADSRERLINFQKLEGYMPQHASSVAASSVRQAMKRKPTLRQKLTVKTL